MLVPCRLFLLPKQSLDIKAMLLQLGSALPLTAVSIDTSSLFSLKLVLDNCV